jgi:hypothetical protein
VSKITRRKKEIEFDGAKFTISPLTYDQVTEHGEMIRQYLESKPDATKLTPEQHKVLQGITFFGICCGLNNADLDGDGAVTPADLAAQMDDVLAGKLWRAIFEFTGMEVPSEEEVKRRLTPGEPQASS